MNVCICSYDGSYIADKKHSETEVQTRSLLCGREMGLKWRALGAEQKNEWQEKAKQEKERAAREKDEYEKVFCDALAVRA